VQETEQEDWKEKSEKIKGGRKMIDKIIKELENEKYPFACDIPFTCYNEGVDKAIKIIKKFENDCWISVEDRFPSVEECEKNDGRFILSDGNRVYQGWFSKYEKHFIREGYTFQKGTSMTEDKCVTYWRNMPEKPYKGE
jgi:hypothetical protein